MFLNERHLLFQYKAIVAGKPHKVTLEETILKVYHERENEGKSLLCELYQHNILLFDYDAEWKNYFTNPKSYKNYIKSLEI
jgi:hypothetical protein